MTDNHDARRPSSVTRRAAVAGLAATAISSSAAMPAVPGTPVSIPQVVKPGATDTVKSLMARGQELIDLINRLIREADEMRTSEWSPHFKAQAIQMASKTYDLNAASEELGEIASGFQNSITGLLADAIEAQDHDRGSAVIIARMLTEREKRRRG